MARKVHISQKAFERSKEDKARDRKEAKKRGISVKAYEGSAADRRIDKKVKAKMEKRKAKR